jgi:hypothetical protein
MGVPIKYSMGLVECAPPARHKSQYYRRIAAHLPGAAAQLLLAVCALLVLMNCKRWVSPSVSRARNLSVEHFVNYGCTARRETSPQHEGVVQLVCSKSRMWKAPITQDSRSWISIQQHKMLGSFLAAEGFSET